MDLIVRTDPPLPLRAWKALRSRGAGYAWHKFLRRTLSDWPAWKRRILYADPHKYWTLRGGDDYFREQEGQKARSLRAEWLADRLAVYRPTSILEVGCGYGKVLGELRAPARNTRSWVSTSAGPNWIRPAVSWATDAISILLLAAANACRLPTIPSTWS